MLSRFEAKGTAYRRKIRQALLKAHSNGQNRAYPFDEPAANLVLQPGIQNQVGNWLAPFIPRLLVLFRDSHLARPTKMVAPMRLGLLA